ncbi:MAG: type II toxin-antitoxin system HicA family toxin [Thermoanaerobaculia bacterium]
MPKLPKVTGKQLVAALSSLGFQLVRTRGSHAFLRHPDGRATVVPVHSGETIGPGLLSRILRDCEITRDDLHNAL